MKIQTRRRRFKFPAQVVQRFFKLRVFINKKSFRIMALWVDKYRPRELAKLDYHVEQAGDLKRLCEQQDFPHLMFFGPR